MSIRGERTIVKKKEKNMNQRIYGDDLTNNEHPFTKGMQNLVKNLEKIDGIVNKNQKPKTTLVKQCVSQLK